MAYRYHDSDVRSVAELITKLDAHRQGGELVWFRGQSDVDWSITPSIFRAGANPLEREGAFFKRFRQNAGRYVDTRVSSDWDWFLLMQHHGIPTRLMDWSESPLIGMYFAVEEGNDTKDGFLYLLLPVEYNISISIHPKIANDLPLIGTDASVDDYMFINKDPSFYAKKPIAAIAQRNSERIFAQQGVFVINGDDFSPFEQVAESYVWRYRIPSSAKSAIRKELGVLGITKAAVFPELSNLANFIKGLIP